MATSAGKHTENVYMAFEEDQAHNSEGEQLTSSSSKEQLEDFDQYEDHLHFPLRVRNFAGTIVENHRFQMGVNALVALNSITMGIGTFDFVDENPDLDRLSEIVDKGFLCVFTFELAL